MAREYQSFTCCFVSDFHLVAKSRTALHWEKSSPKEQPALLPVDRQRCTHPCHLSLLDGMILVCHHLIGRTDVINTTFSHSQCMECPWRGEDRPIILP